MLSVDTLVFHLLGTDLFPQEYADNPVVLTPTQADKASFLRGSSLRSSAAELNRLSDESYLSTKFLVNNSNVLLEHPYPYKRGYYTTNNETEAETFYLGKGYFKIMYDADGNDISEYIQIRKSRPSAVGGCARYLKNPNEMDIIWGIEQPTNVVPDKRPARARVAKEAATNLHKTKSGRTSKIDPKAWF